MAKKIYTSVNTFNAGEVSELIFNREDISKYRSSCRILENALPLVEGGAKKMPGTYFAGVTNNQNAPCRLVPFQFSTTQGSILELSAGAIRIWTPSSVDNWSLKLVESSPGVPLVLPTPYVQADLFDLDCGTQSADVLWIFHSNYPPACIERFSATNWQYALAPPGGQPNESAYRGTSISSVADALGVPILQATQAFPLVLVTLSPFTRGDRIYISGAAGMTEINEDEYYVDPVLDPSQNATFTGKIDGGSSTQLGTILNVSSVGSGTILIGMQVVGANVSPNTIIDKYLSGTGGTGTYQVSVQQLVASSTSMTGVGGFAYYIIPVHGGGVWGVLFTASISGTTMTVTSVAAGFLTVGIFLYFPGVPGGTRITAFGTGTGGIGTYTITPSQSVGSRNMSNVPVVSLAFQPYQGGGFAVKVVPVFNVTGEYPSCGTFYQQRLCLGGTNNKPTTMFGSVQNDFPDFIADPTLDDHAIQFTLVSTLLDQVINMIGTPNALVIGTAGGMWAMSGSSGTSLSQTNVNAAKQTTLGVSRIQPQLIGDAAIFVSRSAKTVMFLVFNFSSNTWENYDLTRLNRGITIGTSMPIGSDVACGLADGGGSVYPLGVVINIDGGTDNLGGITGNNGDVVNLKAIESWSDGSTQDITTVATWSFTGSGIAIALVGAVERVTMTNGNTFALNAVVQAMSLPFRGITYNDTLAITVNGSGSTGHKLIGIALNFDGGTENISHIVCEDQDIFDYWAIGFYDDGTHAVITTSVIWTAGTGATLLGSSDPVQTVQFHNTNTLPINTYVSAQYGTIITTMTVRVIGVGGP